MARLQLSASSLNLINDCPRCFWLDKVKGIKRPRGIFPSLPGGMDRIIKDYFDRLRGPEAKLPKSIAAKLPKGARLWPNFDEIRRWRDWRSGMRGTIQDVPVITALDDVLMTSKEIMSPYDYKTRGTAPKSLQDSERYYGLQLSTYAWAMEYNKFKISGIGYLNYFWPEVVGGDIQDIRFAVEIVQMEATPNLFAHTAEKAIAMLKNETPPEAMPGCEYCEYREG